MIKSAVQAHFLRSPLPHARYQHAVSFGTVCKLRFQPPKTSVYSERFLSSKPTQTRSSFQIPSSDGQRSTNNPTVSSSSVLVEAGGRVPASPANPGVIRRREGGDVLSKIPLDSKSFPVFAKLRRDKNLSDEEAFLQFIRTYDVPLRTLNRISGNQRSSLFCSIIHLLAFIYC